MEIHTRDSTPLNLSHSKKEACLTAFENEVLSNTVIFINNKGNPDHKKDKLI